MQNQRRGEWRAEPFNSYGLISLRDGSNGMANATDDSQEAHNGTQTVAQCDDHLRLGLDSGPFLLRDQVRRRPFQPFARKLWHSRQPQVVVPVPRENRLFG